MASEPETVDLPKVTISIPRMAIDYEEIEKASDPNATHARETNSNTDSDRNTNKNDSSFKDDTDISIQITTSSSTLSIHTVYDSSNPQNNIEGNSTSSMNNYDNSDLKQAETMNNNTDNMNPNPMQENEGRPVTLSQVFDY